MAIRVRGGLLRIFARVLELLYDSIIISKNAGFGLLKSPMRKQRSYQIWLDKYDKSFAVKFSSKTAGLSRIEPNFRISLILNTGLCTEKQMLDLVDSVKFQSYPHWQLCIISHALPATAKARLFQLAAADFRLEIVSVIADSFTVAVNKALAKVDGRHVVFLDGKGVLSPDALYWVAREISANPVADLIYCDEDQIDCFGQRSAPHFKPDWNPDLFLTWNYIGTLSVFRTGLARQIGGFRACFAECQEYDFALRTVAFLKGDCVRHIPRILYHNYLQIDSDDCNETISPNKTELAAKAVLNRLEQLDVSAIVSIDLEMPGCLRVQYKLPPVLPKITLIIPTRNGLELLRGCVQSIRSKTDYSNYEIIIVDNGSNDTSTLNYLESFIDVLGVRVIHDDRLFNFSRLNNFAVTQADGELIGLLNNDLEVINPDWLSEMVSQALRPEIGIVGARLWYPNETIQHAGVILSGGVPGHVHKGLPRGCNGYFGRAALTQNFVAVTGACMVLRKDLYLKAGGLDEAFAVAFNDIDLCLRVLALGYRNLWTPYAELYHHESASRGREDTSLKMVRYLEELKHMHNRWGDAMFTDASYNPNLNARLKDFSLAWPPNHAKSSAG